MDVTRPLDAKGESTWKIRFCEPKYGELDLSSTKSEADGNLESIQFQLTTFWIQKANNNLKAFLLYTPTKSHFVQILKTITKKRSRFPCYIIQIVLLAIINNTLHHQCAPFTPNK